MSYVKQVNKQQFPYPRTFQAIFLICLVAGVAFLLSARSGLADPPPPAAASILTTVDGGDDSVGLHTSLALNSSGHPVISYFDNTNGTLKLAVCSDATCSNPTLTTVDDGGDDVVGLDTSLALNDNDHPVISYHDYTNGALKLAVCSDATCSNPTLTTVDDGGDDVVGLDTSLALNDNDHPVISYFDGFPNYDLKLAVCNDAACTVRTTTIVDGGGGDIVGRYTSLALNSSGHPVISYYDGTPDETLKLAVCDDAACTNPTLTTVDSAGDVGSNTSLALNGSGHPVISYLDGTNTALKLAVCNDAACTVRTTTTVDDGGDGGVGSYTSLALNSSDHPVISYHDYTNGDLKLAVCNDVTCTNPTINVVDGDAATNTGRYTSLALSSSGYPVISYFDQTNDDLKMAVCNICLTPTVTTVDSPDTVGQHASLALDSSGGPVISYFDNTNDDLKLAVCNNAICTSPTLTTVDSVGDYTSGQTISLALNSSGKPVISYYNSDDGDLKIAFCNNTACSNPTLQTVDSSGNVGKWSSLVLNSSGFPVISYYDETDFDLKVAVCNDATCTNPTIKVVDGAATITGGYTSLALNSSGFPVISYYQWTNQALKLAVCDDAVCNSATIQTVDSDGDVGQYTSLALNSSGFPVISYYDASNDDLKVAVCNNAACTQPTLTTVDAPGDVGRYTSLALTGTDYPIISYYDLANDDLKLAVCNDIVCTTPTMTTVDSPGNVGQYNSLALNSNGYPVIGYYDAYPNNNLKVAVFESATVNPGNTIYLPLILRNDG